MFYLNFGSEAATDCRFSYAGPGNFSICFSGRKFLAAIFVMKADQVKGYFQLKNYNCKNKKNNMPVKKIKWVNDVINLVKVPRGERRFKNRPHKIADKRSC